MGIRKLFVTCVTVPFLLCGGIALYFFRDQFIDELTVPLKNTPVYLSIPTYTSKTRSVVHPDIINFTEPWNGYKYWMVFTPMGIEYEFPSIVVSNNGYSWKEPAGINNPIDITPMEPDGWHCDPDMIYNDDVDELWVYYQGFTQNNVFLLRKKSSNGIYWSSEESILSIPKKSSVAPLLSPSVVKTDSTCHLWYVVSSSRNYIEHRTSPDCTHWSLPRKISFKTHYNPWHIDVIYVPSKDEYWMIFPAYPPEGNVVGMNIFFAKSSDGINWKVYDNRPTLIKGDFGWTANRLYRATMLYDKDTDMLKVWYSAVGDDYKWHIGYTQREYSKFALTTAAWECCLPALRRIKRWIGSEPH